MIPGMMESPAKKVAIAILSKDKKFGPGEMEGDSESDKYADEGKNAAAKDMIDAFHAKDASGLVAAFDNYLELCKQEEQSESPALEEKEMGEEG